MNRIYLAAALALALLVMAGGVLLERQHYGAARYSAGEKAGGDAVRASDARATAQLQQQHDQLEQFSALATTGLNQFLGEKLPAIEAQTHASQESIRFIYRDRAVPDDLCSRPAGVQQQLDEAVDAANATGTAHVQL